MRVSLWCVFVACGKMRGVCDNFGLCSRMQAPGIRGNDKTLYMSTPPMLEERTRKNLPLPLQELGITDGTELHVTDPAVPGVVKIVIKFESGE